MGLSDDPEPDPARWTPIRVDWKPTGAEVDWCRTDGLEFTDPYFDDTLRRAFSDPFRLLFRRRSSMAELAEPRSAATGLAPSGFILHISRCGSTLVTQMLARCAQVLVLSEPGALDGVLRARARYPEMSESDAVAMLQGMVRALAQPGPRHRHVVVKLDGWALFSLPLIRVAFPDVPWVLMYRDPEEVLISQQRRAGYHMIPGTLSAADVGLAESVDLVATASSLLDHQARILQLLLEVAAAHLDDGPPLLVDYTELPGAVLERVAPWFGIDRDLLEDAGALDAAAFDLKNPHLTYNPDAVAGRRMATDELRAAAGRCAEAHASLVARRGPLTLTEPAPG